MRELNMESLQEIVRNDSKSRYNLVPEADPASGDEAWWIRANQGHSLKVSLASLIVAGNEFVL